MSVTESDPEASLDYLGNSWGSPALALEAVRLRAFSQLLDQLLTLLGAKKSWTPRRLPSAESLRSLLAGLP